MLRNLLILVLAVLVFWYGADFLLAPQQPQAMASDKAAITPPASLDRPLRQYADISVHDPDELQLLFDRVEAILDRPRGEGEAPIISLVLHGPEVEFFALKNYPRYKAIVDRAAKLSAFGAVDISICQTQMRLHGIGKKEVPIFLRQVPFGPAEVKRLRDEGYVAM